MWCSHPSAIDAAFDTLYDLNAVFIQFLVSAKYDLIFSLLLLLAPSLSRRLLFFLSFFLFYFLLFYFLFFFFFPLSFIFLYNIFSLFSSFQLTCASVVRMRSDRYYVYHVGGSLSWVASGIIVGFSRRE